MLSLVPKIAVNRLVNVLSRPKKASASAPLFKQQKRGISSFASKSNTMFGYAVGSIVLFGAGVALWQKEEETIAHAEESQPLPASPSISLSPQSIYVLGRTSIPGKMDDSPMLVPHQIYTDIKPASASFGDDDGWIIDTKGKLHTWNNSSSSKLSPVLSGYSFKQVECGKNGFVALLQTNGSIWMRKDKDSEFQIVNKGDLKRKTVSKIAAGHEHVAALTTDGKLYTLGQNSHGQCGIVEFNQSPADDPHCVTWKDATFTDVASGAYHTVAITKSGQVVGFGWNKAFQLALPQEFVRYSPPSIPMVTFGSYHEVRKSEQDRFNSKGYIDTDEYISMYAHPNPTQIDYFAKKDIHAQRVVCGDDFTFIIDDKGDLFGFGDGSRGQLARNPARSYVPPTLIHRQPFGNHGASKIMDFTCGSAHCMASTTSGELYAWGWNQFGACGTNSKATVFVPTRVLDSNTTPIKKVVCRKDSSAIIL